MRIPKRVILIFPLMLSFSICRIATLAAADQEIRKTQSQGYAFFAPGTSFGNGNSDATAHIGGGFEASLHKGFGVGAEIGRLSLQRNLSDAVGILSINGSYHFNHTRRLSPFITAGYSLAFRSEQVNLFNYGGGVNYWFHKQVGLRLEFRDHVNRNVHYVGVRIGLSFR